MEIPAGSSNKYEYNAAAGVMALDRVLHSSVRYPFDYGFVPNVPSLVGFGLAFAMGWLLARRLVSQLMIRQLFRLLQVE